MGAKFHVAMFCSSVDYAARKTFYAAMFGVPSWEGDINDGPGNHRYWGSKWDCEGGLIFALLKNSELAQSHEKLAHIGIMFDARADFDAEVKRRGIDVQQINVYPAGERQVFVQDRNGVEWEFACTETANR